MKLAIFGVRDAGYVKEQVERNTGGLWEVVILADNKEELWDTEMDLSENKKVKIISCQALSERYHRGEIDGVLVAVRNGHNRWCIADQLQKAGITKVGFVKPSAITYRWPIVFSENQDSSLRTEQIVWMDEVKKPMIHYLEIHAIDSCNLNCKGCLHFSSLYHHSERPDIDQLIRDVHQLSKLCYIFHLRVLGGEPLLNPDLDILLKKLRDILPDTDIGIVTNGTLITRQKKELFETMKENKIGFNITLYPPTHEKKEEIYRFLDEVGVSYGSHLAKVDEFSKGLMAEPKKGKITSHMKCVSKNCFFLREGKLYKCAVEALINRFYETYNMDLRMDTGLDIYNETLDWGKIIPGMYEHPVSLCRYCSDEPQAFIWGVANPPKKEEWMVEV